MVQRSSRARGHPHHQTPRRSIDQSVSPMVRWRAAAARRQAQCHRASRSAEQHTQNTELQHNCCWLFDWPYPKEANLGSNLTRHSSRDPIFLDRGTRATRFVGEARRSIDRPESDAPSKLCPGFVARAGHNSPHERWGAAGCSYPTARDSDGPSCCFEMVGEGGRPPARPINQWAAPETRSKQHRIALRVRRRCLRSDLVRFECARGDLAGWFVG